MIKRITIDYILSLGPCYRREELEGLFRGDRLQRGQTRRSCMVAVTGGLFHQKAVNAFSL